MREILAAMRFTYLLFTFLAILSLTIPWLSRIDNPVADIQFMVFAGFFGSIAVLLKVLLNRRSLSRDQLETILRDVGFNTLEISNFGLKVKGSRPDGTYISGYYIWDTLRGRINPSWGLAGDNNMTLYAPVPPGVLLFHMCRVADGHWNIQPLKGVVDIVHLSDGTVWLKENLPLADFLSNEFTFKIQFADTFTAVMFGPRSPADPFEIERNIHDAVKVVDHIIENSEYTPIGKQATEKSLAQTIRQFNTALGH